MDAHPVPIETLLAHRAWVRGVARAVVHDPNAADDVEQETWLAALSSPPRDESAVRGWFRVVLRNRARQGGRAESRRERRETASARPEATPSAAELAELADTHRRVVQVVVELAEPYRETILLRYFEGLAVEDVAARTGEAARAARARVGDGRSSVGARARAVDRGTEGHRRRRIGRDGRRRHGIDRDEGGRGGVAAARRSRRGRRVARDGKRLERRRHRAVAGGGRRVACRRAATRA